MTIEVEVSPDVEAALALRAATRSMDVPTYAAALLAQAVQPAIPDETNGTRRPKPRPAGRKSLVTLFADSPFSGLDLSIERDPDYGRDIEL
jgi:hypothetical protein